MVIGTPTVLNLIPGKVFPVVNVNQYDAGYEKTFLLYKGAEPFNIAANMSVTIRGTKGDKNGITDSAASTRGSNLVSVTLTEQMTAIAGPNIYELRIVDTNGLLVGTVNFILMVEPAALGDNTVISDSDLNYAVDVLDRLQSVEAFKNQLDAASEDIEDLKDDKISRYDTVAQMKADAALEAGMYAHTGGYYATNDGGGALYRVSATEPVSDFYEALTNGLYAVLITTGKINALSLGFHRNDGVDNHALLASILQHKESKMPKAPLTLVFPGGTYAFSPTQIKAWGLTLEGEGNPFGTPTRFLSTVFVPVANQDYIIMVGSSDTDKYLDSYVYVGNAIKRIQFRCNKHGTTSPNGTANNWKMNIAMLVIYRQYMSEFNDIALYYSYGTALRMASSWECMFGGTLMVRNVFAPEHGAVTFATDFLKGTTVSDTSSCFFNSIELEAIAGNYINFEKDCNFENNIFGSIMVEDYRLDMPDRASSEMWGTTWTISTWLPSGVASVDEELAIFNFEEGAYYSNNTINNITASMYAVRSYYYQNRLYSHVAIVKCSGFPKRLDFQCSLLNVQYNRTDVRTLIYPFEYAPKNFNFNIDNAVLNDNAFKYVLSGRCRNYVVNDIRGSNPTEFNHGFKSAYKECVMSNNQVQSSTAVSGETVRVYAPVGKGDDSSLTNERVCAVAVNLSMFPGAGALGPCRIPIIGNTLHVRIYQDTANTLVYAIYGFDGTQKNVGNFAAYGAGWQWVTIDTSGYLGENCVSFSNRAGNYPNNLIDVFYWT